MCNDTKRNEQPRLAWGASEGGLRNSSNLSVSLAQIAETSKIAHTLWFTLLGLLAYAFVTLLAVEDKDFFAYNAKTQLPLLNIQIPTASFFAFAPFLIAASYIHLHLYLHRLWKLLAELPARDENGQPIARRVYPWLISYAALLARSDSADQEAAFRWAILWLSRVFLWWAAPAVLLFFWWWSMPAHDEMLTLWIGGLLISTAWTGFKAGWTSMLLLRHAGKAQTGFRTVGMLGAVLLPILAFKIIFISWSRTEGWMSDLDFRRYFQANIEPGAFLEAKRTHPRPRPKGAVDVSAELQPGSLNLGLLEVLWHFNSAGRSINEYVGTPYVWSHWIIQRHRLPSATRSSIPRFISNYNRSNKWNAPMPLAQASMLAAEICIKPTDWKAYDLAKKEFRAEFIARKHIEFGASWNESVSIWEIELEADWKATRDEYISRVVRPDLTGIDFREARLNSAFLVGVNLSGARLDDAKLWDAQLESAVLYDASLVRAILMRTHLERANLARAQMVDAILASAHMQGADLSDAVLTGATLTGVDLQDADLRGANLVDANLSGANLKKVSLGAADLEFCILSESCLDETFLGAAHMERALLNHASMQRCDLSAANLSGAILFGADLTGAKLRSTILAGAILDSAALCRVEFLSPEALEFTVGNEDTVFPDGLQCWSCLRELPTLPEKPTRPRTWDDEWYKKRVLCKPGEEPRRVGRKASECAECQEPAAQKPPEAPDSAPQN